MLIKQNYNLIGEDFARQDRRKFLQSIPAPKKLRHGQIAPGVWSNQICGLDVSSSDRRSVKAYLNGVGDHRTLWWNICAFFIGVFHQDANLEEKMYRFHKYHQDRYLIAQEELLLLNSSGFRPKTYLKIAITRWMREIKDIA